MLDLAAFSDILETNYQEALYEQLNSSHVLMDNIERDTSKRRFRGKDAYYGLHTARSGGFGTRPEGAVLPRPSRQSYDAAIFGLIYAYMRIRLTRQTMVLATDGGAIADAVDGEVNGAVRDAMENLSRMLWHDGSGVLTNTGVTSGVTLVVVKSTRFIHKGMFIDIVNPTTGVPITDGVAREVTAVNSATTFTIGGTLTSSTANPVTTTDNGQVIVITDSPRGTDALWENNNADIWGLEAIVSASNPGNGQTGANALFGRIDRTAADSAFWKANEVTGGVIDATLSILQEAYDVTDIEGGAVPGLIITSHAAARAIANAITATRQYVKDDMQLKAGWKGIQFNNAAIVADRHASLTNNPLNATVAQFDRVYFVAPNSMEWQMGDDWHWLEIAGSKWFPTGVGNAAVDSMDATYAAMLNLCCTRPNANTVLLNVA